MPAVQIRTRTRGPRKKYPLGSVGHFEQIKERRAERSLDVQFNRGINQLKRERMGLPASEPMYQIGTHVATIGGTPGRIIGSAQYVTGWEYRIAPDNKKRTIYREEWQIHPNPGLASLYPGHGGIGEGELRDPGPMPGPDPTKYPKKGYETNL